MVAVRHAPRMWLALRGGAVVGSPGRMWVWVALHRALLVGRRLVVIELVVLVIVETIAPPHSPWGRGPSVHDGPSEESRGGEGEAEAQGQAD